MILILRTQTELRLSCSIVQYRAVLIAAVVLIMDSIDLQDRRIRGDNGVCIIKPQCWQRVVAAIAPFAAVPYCGTWHARRAQCHRKLPQRTLQRVSTGFIISEYFRNGWSTTLGRSHEWPVRLLRQ
jgi:hypothetical protein